MIQWKKRPALETTIAARRRIWESHCRRFRVVESQSLYGSTPARFYAMRHDMLGWDTISKHRKRATAVTACERAAKEG